jgi:predicted TIM-barrel fold metal-dependent hydrolase
MKIDAFTHIMTPNFRDRFQKAAADAGNVVPMWMADDLIDVDRRFRMMDELGIDKQVVCLGSMPIEYAVPDTRVASELARICNDELAEVAARYPDRLIPVGVISMTDMEAGTAEAERCLKDLGMKGIEIYANANGRAIDNPEFFPFYSLMQTAGAPIWLHPARPVFQPDYIDEDESKYMLAIVLGWEYETTTAMARLVLSGILEEFPGIKFIVHHAGSLVPVLEQRIIGAYTGVRTAHGDHKGGADAPQRTYTVPTGETKPLPHPVIDYFRMFYTDTACSACSMAIRGALDFYGADHLLFGTDAPLDTVGGEGGRNLTLRHLEVVDSLDVSPAARDLIYSGNLLRLLASGA